MNFIRSRIFLSLFILYCKLNFLIKNRRETYRYFASLSPSNGIPSIGNNTFLELINSFGPELSSSLNLSDIDLEFIATNSSSK